MTTLFIRTPEHRIREFSWVCSVIFGHWLGLKYCIEIHDKRKIEVSIGNYSVQWSDTFFSKSHANWLQPQSLPTTAPTTWPIPDDDLRTRIGESHVAQFFGDGHFEMHREMVHLPIDITGSIFFFLTRYEEAVINAEVDQHGRFPGRKSVAHCAGMALRPVVDEWVELLWWSLKKLVPELTRKPRNPTVWVSCDVDAPYSPGSKSIALAMHQTASALWNHHSLQLAGRTLLNAAASRIGVTRFDPYDTFDWMLDVNECVGNRVTFFFLNIINPARIDGFYELNEPRVSILTKRIIERGHEIGLHGSYYSIDDREKISNELLGLRLAVASAGGNSTQMGGRQHYLRWHMNGTAHILNQLGLIYDSTLGFPDIAGFRCGTSHAFPIFDLFQREELALMERPLVLMEVTVTSPTYLNLGYGLEARKLMMSLRESCRRFGGEFSLLWHNSNLVNPEARELYKSLIQPF